VVLADLDFGGADGFQLVAPFLDADAGGVLNGPRDGQCCEYDG